MYSVTIKPKPEQKLKDLEEKYYTMKYCLVQKFLDISNLDEETHPLFIYNNDQERKKNLLQYKKENAQKMGIMKSEVGKKT